LGVLLCRIGSSLKKSIKSYNFIAQALSVDEEDRQKIKCEQIDINELRENSLEKHCSMIFAIRKIKTICVNILITDKLSINMYSIW
jgi:hypothetical protein